MMTKGKRVERTCEARIVELTRPELYIHRKETSCRMTIPERCGSGHGEGTKPASKTPTLPHPRRFRNAPPATQSVQLRDGSASIDASFHATTRVVHPAGRHRDGPSLALRYPVRHWWPGPPRGIAGLSGLQVAQHVNCDPPMMTKNVTAARYNSAMRLWSRVRSHDVMPYPSFSS